METFVFNNENKSEIEYPNVPSDIKPIAHLTEIPGPVKQL